MSLDGGAGAVRRCRAPGAARRAGTRSARWAGSRSRPPRTTRSARGRQEAALCTRLEKTILELFSVAQLICRNLGAP